MRWGVAAAVLLTACGRYEDFRLPALKQAPGQGQYRWSALEAPILGRGAPGAFDSVDVLNPSVVRADGGLFNFYSGFDGATWHTGLATSSDGINWEKRGRVLSPQGWEGRYIAANGSALVQDGQFYYWYQAGAPPRIAMARSSDGSSFSRHAQPVLEPGPRGSWDERGVADPYVVRFGDFFYMFFLGQDRAGRQRLGLARSGDGVVWTKLRANPILELGEDGQFDENGLGEPAVWWDRGYYWMLYTGRDRHERRRMGLARSRDGVQWEKLASPIIEGTQPWNRHVVCDASIEVRPDGVHVWFGGGDVARPDERLNGQIGYGVLRWVESP